MTQMKAHTATRKVRPRPRRDATPSGNESSGTSTYTPQLPVPPSSSFHLDGVRRAENIAPKSFLQRPSDIGSASPNSPIAPRQSESCRSSTSSRKSTSDDEQYRSSIKIRKHVPVNLQARPGAANVYRTEKWRQQPEVTVHIKRNAGPGGLPISITTLDLWKIFNAYGNIQRIEIFENSMGTADGGAKIIFFPPPSQAFWEVKPYFLCDMPDGSRHMMLELSLMENRRSYTVVSPVNPDVQFPESSHVPAESIDFGFMFEADTMMTMFTTLNTSKITFQTDLKCRWLSIKFSHFFEDPPNTPVEDSKARLEQYQFRIPFAALKKIFKIENEERELRTLLITLDSPPLFWRKIHHIEKSHDKPNSRIWNESDSWFRQTDILPEMRKLRTQPLAIKKQKPTIDIGRWTTYRFIFKPNDIEAETMEVMLKALEDFNLGAVPFPKPGFRCIQDHGSRVWDIIDQPVLPASSAPLSFAEELMASDSVTTVLRYPVRYQLEVCISQGRLSEFNLTKEFIDRLGMYGPQKYIDVYAIELEQEENDKAVRLLEIVAEIDERFYDTMKIFELPVPVKPPMTIPSYCVQIRKATITPAMIYYSSPTIETSNRVIRQYHHVADRFLRVQFTDEKFSGKVSPNEFENSNEIFTRVNRAMANGIIIGDRHFEFLGFGNSQLRSHGAYFFCPTEHETTDSIRSWMGDFQSIRQVAKYAARLGQCFSTTRAITAVKVSVQDIPDIEQNDFCFSDGCGQISEVVAQFISSELKLSKDLPPPSCFQFRLSGCKGVLAVNPGIVSSDKNSYSLPVCIRPSQRKFRSEHNGLEIIRSSQFASATLNRQLIAVLSTLGVDDIVFMRKLKNQLRNLEMSMTDPSYALDLLRKNIDPNQATLHLAALIIEGFMAVKDPFVMNLLYLWRAWSIKTLKEKARIVLDEGAFLLGVIDETAKLKGHIDVDEHQDQTSVEMLEHLPEIFLQIPDPDSPNRFKVVEGVCLLARNPSLHPGDIRTVRAVPCLELMHLRNVVVLPQTGTQPLSNMCSGGDLDGDDYIVVWDEDFTPSTINHPPMDYTAPSPIILDRDVEVPDISSFFVTYMKNDKLGAIAHAHLAWADKMDEGVMSKQCIQLANLHSMAVDYNKTGKPATMTKDLRPRTWPHFMEKFTGRPEKSYESKKILGQLYDAVDRISFQPKFGTESSEFVFDNRILRAFSFENDKETLRSTRSTKIMYDEAMRRVMAQHGIQSEYEIYSTFILHHSGVSNDYKFHEEIGQITMAFKDRFCLLIEHILSDKRPVLDGKTKPKPTEYELGRFAAAMYTITNEEYTAALAKSAAEVKEVPLPLISFPWLYAQLLGKIANGNGVFKQNRDGRCIRGLDVDQKPTEEEELGYLISGLNIANETNPNEKLPGPKGIVDLGEDGEGLFSKEDVEF